VYPVVASNTEHKSFIGGLAVFIVHWSLLRDTFARDSLAVKQLEEMSPVNGFKNL